MRIYDPRLGRFLSVDPINKEYPDLTPYQFASNTPIWAIDLDGLEGFVATGMPMGNSGHGHGMVISVPDARKVNNSVANWFSSNHQQGMRNVRIAEQAKQQAIKQGRIDGDGITWWTKTMVYLSPWWNSTATFTDANDAAVLMEGKNLDGSDATVGDYAAAGIGIFIPFISGSSIKNIFKGFSTSVEGYKYGGKTFKNDEQFEKALVTTHYSHRISSQTSWSPYGASRTPRCTGRASWSGIGERPSSRGTIAWPAAGWRRTDRVGG
jgi:hypothetical protein